VFDREAVFVKETLSRVVDRHPRLRIVLEHVSTAEAVDWVRGAPENVAATITAHHLLYDRNAMFEGGMRPHMYCLPVLKRARHREALVAAATSGDPKFFLGTDSAPHSRAAKEASCGCAGVFTAHAAIELYAEAFERAGAIEKLADFASRFGARFYGLPIATETIELAREPWTVPASYPLVGGELVPLRAGETIAWQLRAAPAILER
jgi:dihydroorotase